MLLALLLPLLQNAHAQAPDEAVNGTQDTPVAEEPPPLVEGPSVLAFVQAEYPPDARASSIEASVLLAIEIGEDGLVRGVEVLRPAGHGFDEAAATAARAMRFSPARDANGPVPVIIEFEYGFKLESTAIDASGGPDAGASAADAPPPPITLEGQLVEMGTRRPLPDFPIRVEPLGLETLTDAEGRFDFRGLPPGSYTLRAGQPGWDPVSQPVEVTSGQITTARLWIRSQSYGDPGILGIYAVETADVSKRTISIEEVRRVPGTFGDPVRVIQTMPGAARAPFGTGLLVIRGSNPEDSGVYVDGIRIPYIYHLGGFASVINPDLVAAVDYLPGGFGPRYGRSTGGVVDVTTRTEFPERTKVAASMDLLDAGAVASGTLGKNGRHAFGVAARRSYVDAILPLFLAEDGYSIKPRWYDYQAKWQWRGDGGRSASILVFGFEDVLTASTPAGLSQGTDQDAQGDLGTDYSTHRVIARWQAPLAEDWDFVFTPSFGRDYASFVLGNDWRIEQGQWIAEIRAEAPWQPSEHFRLVPGVDFIGGWADFTILLPFDPSSFAELDPLAEREPFGLSDEQAGWGPDTYVLAEWRPLAEPDDLLIAPGLRLDYINLPGQLAFFALDPRFSTKWRATDATLLKGSVGLYHQPPQPFQSYRSDGNPVGIGPERALAASVGIEQKIGPAVRVEVEGFYKALDQLIVGNRAFTSLEDPFFTNEGVGRAYGTELMLRHERVRNFFGWLSYTLSRSERKDYPDGDWYPFDYDQTHILVATAGYALPYDFELGAKAEYVTGNPTTPYALGVYDVDQDFYQGIQSGAYNSERLPDYAALSLRVDKLFTFRAWQLSVYCDFINVLRGVNPEFEVYNYDYTERTYVRGLPFLPSPGFEARFEL